MITRMKTILKYAFQYACITHCTFEYVSDFVLCNGPSMEPTLFSNNILLTERLSRFWRGYKAGDIIIAVSPLNAEQFICKRIVAVSGDSVMTQIPPPLQIDAAKETTNPAYTKLVPVYVPLGCVWIEGDNKKNSSDSRYYGAIPLGLVKSRVVCRIWPLSEWAIL